MIALLHIWNILAAYLWYRFLASAFTERRGKQGYALARELKRRKAERKYGPEPGPVLEVLTRELTAEERKALLRQLRTAESRK